MIESTVQDARRTAGDLRRFWMNKWAILAIGVLLVPLGLFVRHQGTVHTNEVEVSGEIVDIDVTETTEVVDRDGRQAVETKLEYTSTIEYQDSSSGSARTFVDSTRSGGVPRVGDIVRVAHNADDPASVRVVHGNQVPIGIGISGLGLLLTLISVGRLAVQGSTGNRLEMTPAD